MEPISFFAQYKWIFVFLHVFSVVGAMGSALAIDYMTTYFAQNKVFSRSEIRTLTLLIKGVTIGLWLVVLTGILIFFSNPAGYLASSKFITKMIVVGILCINGFILHRYVFSHIAQKNVLTDRKHAAIRTRGFVFGAVSFVSWATALLLALQPSIPFSVTTAVSMYLFVLLVAIAVAVLLSKRY